MPPPGRQTASPPAIAEALDEPQVACQEHACRQRHEGGSAHGQQRRRNIQSEIKHPRTGRDRAFHGAAEWAKRDARPSDEEIDALHTRIRGEEDKLGHATEEQRNLITNASAVLRKARAVGQAGITLRRPNGEDALHPHVDDRRHAVDIMGRATSD